VSATVVLVHGAWHGAWCWERVVPLLDDAGIASIAIDLPGHGDSPAPLGDLVGDAAAVRQVLDTLDDVVVCAHSYGGVVVTEGAAGHPGVRHLAYIASFPLEPGESAASAVAAFGTEGEESELNGAFVLADDGTSTLDPDRALSAFLADCPPDAAANAIARVDRHPMATLSAAVTRAAWRQTPSTYVICSQDRAVPPGVQRVLSRRCTRTIEWPTSHSPFLSRPELVADLLIELAGP
jgi:pimeloyl-ACP methyl ester carboxylesterase